MSSLWADCLSHLQTQYSEQEFITWLRPVKAVENADELALYAHNPFQFKWIRDNYLEKIIGLARYLSGNENLKITFQEGLPTVAVPPSAAAENADPEPVSAAHAGQKNGLNRHLTFESFVQGNSNQIAKSIAEQVAGEPGGHHHNPYFIYGGTGLGKTHLMHAIGNEILKSNPRAKIRYITGERFMSDRGYALEKRNIEDFKRYYRSLDVLLVDEIQYMAERSAKNQSLDEFLNIFNTLLENGKQVVLVSNLYPQNIEGLDEKVKSRLMWGVTAAIEPPDLETRVAILIQKAAEMGTELDKEVAYFIAQKLRTDVRALESAIKNLVPWAKFIGSPITVDSARERLKDMFDSYDHLITVEKIQKVVAEYYNLKPSDLRAKSRTRTIARPRQVAMALAKELTTRSLPEIGREFERDHTTVMHACKTISELRASDAKLQEDYILLTRKLSS